MVSKWWLIFGWTITLKVGKQWQNFSFWTMFLFKKSKSFLNISFFSTSLLFLWLLVSERASVNLFSLLLCLFSSFNLLRHSRQTGHYSSSSWSGPQSVWWPLIKFIHFESSRFSLSLTESITVLLLNLFLWYWQSEDYGNSHSLYMPCVHEYIRRLDRKAWPESVFCLGAVCLSPLCNTSIFFTLQIILILQINIFPLSGMVVFSCRHPAWRVLTLPSCTWASTVRMISWSSRSRCRFLYLLRSKAQLRMQRCPHQSPKPPPKLPVMASGAGASKSTSSKCFFDIQDQTCCT